MRRLTPYFLILLLVVIGIVSLINFRGCTSLIVAIANVCLFGATAAYVVLTERLLQNSRKQLIFAHKPTIVLDFDSYDIGYYSENGDMNISFTFKASNPSDHAAFSLSHDIYFKVGTESLLPKDVTIKQGKELMSFLPSRTSGEKSIHFSYHFGLPTRLLSSDGNYSFDLKCTVRYKSDIGEEHTTTAQGRIDLTIPYRSMIGQATSIKLEDKFS